MFSISGLYSQEEIKKMEVKLKHEVKEKSVQVKEPKGVCTPEQLRSYFKFKAEIQEKTDKLELKKTNITKVNSWVPILVCKSGSQEFPLNLFVIFNREQVPIEEFAVKCGITLRKFMKLIIKDRMVKQEAKPFFNDLKPFKKHLFLDLNHSKKKELMGEMQCSFARQRREIMFPALRLQELKQSASTSIRSNRSMNEQNLSQSCRKESSENKEL
jgi:hypothetical protein